MRSSFCKLSVNSVNLLTRNKPNFYHTRHLSSIVKNIEDLKSSYDVVIVGGGHNGLVSSAYLAKAGYSVCVVEKRGVVGGAAVTEEIVPGFKFSRASYVLSLLRPFIIEDLKLKEHGLKFYMREPYSSYTPIRESLWESFPAKSLLLSSSADLTSAEIGKFSKEDARNYHEYEKEMGKFVETINKLLDNRPPNLTKKEGFYSMERMRAAGSSARALLSLGSNLPQFHETLTASAAKVLNKWFTSEPLKATLATDALIGTMSGPNTPDTGYVLLHHIMGGVNGKAGAWAYPEGGMGGVSQAIASSAASLGVHIFTNQEIQSIEYKDGKSGLEASGVVTKDGKMIEATKAVFSGATPHVTFKNLFKDPTAVFGTDFVKAVNSIDYTSPVTKINVAVDKLPNFSADPSNSGQVGNPHKCTIHLNCESMADLEDSFSVCSKENVPSRKPMIEMVIPSSLDPTLAPKGAHVCLLFTQYTPFSPSDGSWKDESYTEKYAQTVFDAIEAYAPGFKASIVGKEVLSPYHLEETFGLTGGNIFHGSMSFDQLFWLRPILTDKCWFPETPMKKLYLCGSGCHPGGGVMGLPGYFSAKALMSSKG